MARVDTDAISLHRIQRARRMNLVALGFFIAALIALAGFHFTEWDTVFRIHGWRIWPALWQMAQSPDFSETIEAIGLVMFPTFVLLAACSPFLMGVLRKSRLAWWILVLLSGGCLIAVGCFAISESPLPDEPEELGMGFFCLTWALVLNFLGMLFVRRDVQASMLPEIHDGGSEER